VQTYEINVELTLKKKEFYFYYPTGDIINLRSLIWVYKYEKSGITNFKEKLDNMNMPVDDFKDNNNNNNINNTNIN
jgi:hypothetical protein